MIYYNLHTHQPPESVNEKAIISIDLRKHLSLNASRHYSVGIHPWYADKNMIELLYTTAKQSTIIAIGEAGLDKLTETPWELQKEVFLYQVKLAETLQKPLIIHCVKAWPELMAIFKMERPTIPWIIHGFRGKRVLAKQLLTMGFYLSFGQHYQSEAVWEAWNQHRLFVETDDKEANIQTVYDSVSTTLAISQAALTEEVLTNMQAWPDKPF